MAGLQARLDGARFDLQNTTVRAPSRGLVPRMFLKEGRQVSPLQSVLTFMDTSELLIGGLFSQVSFQNIRLGNKAFVNFSALPGQIFETEVIIIPRAIGDSQLMATGTLPKVMNHQTARLFPIYLKLPEGLPEEYHNVGTAASVYIHTEDAGAFGKVANAIQWLSSSLALFL